MSRCSVKGDDSGFTKLIAIQYVFRPGIKQKTVNLRDFHSRLIISLSKQIDWSNETEKHKARMVAHQKINRKIGLEIG